MDLSRPSSPTSPAQSRSARADSPGLCLVGFSISPSMETWHLWASSLATLTIKKGGLCLDGFFCISVQAHCLLSCLWTPLRRGWLSLYSPSNDIYLDRLIKSPAEPPFCRPSNTRSLRCSGPLTIFVGFCCICSSMPISVFYCGAQHWTQKPKCVSWGEESPPSTCWQHLLMQPRRLLSCFTAWAPGWLVVNVSSTGTSCINSREERNGEATTCNRHKLHEWISGNFRIDYDFFLRDHRDNRKSITL